MARILCFAPAASARDELMKAGGIELRITQSVVRFRSAMIERSDCS